MRRGLTAYRRQQVLDSMTAPFKVMFCGEEFAFGYKLTAEQLRQDPKMQVLYCAKNDVALHIHDVDVAVPLMSRMTAAVMDKAPRLKMILQYGVGVEGVDIPAATQRGIWVSNIPSVGTGNALSCAEHAIYLTLALLRDQHAMDSSIANQRVGVPLGQTLHGKKVLVVGYGNIAKELIPRLQPFGVRLSAVRKSSWPPQGTDAGMQSLEQTGTWPELQSMLGDVDLVILTCSQNEVTRGMVNHTFLQHCKPGVRIVNVARGGLLDYDAVKDGLESGQVGGLGLDVQWQEPFDPEDYIAKHPRVVLTPHIAGVTELSYRSMAEIVAAEVRRIRQGLPPTIQLNSFVK